MDPDGVPKAGSSFPGSVSVPSGRPATAGGQGPCLLVALSLPKVQGSAYFFKEKCKEKGGRDGGKEGRR